MKILFTGLSGLVGSHIANSLLLENNNYDICSVVRNTNFSSKSLGARFLPNKIYFGNIEDLGFLSNLLNEFHPDLIVHLAQIKFTPNIIRAIKINNISPHLLILGTTGVFSQFKECSDIYLRSEAYLRNNYENFTVLRSSLIFGSHYDRNFNKLFKRIIKNRALLIPKIALKSQYQPIYYKDLGNIILNQIKEKNKKNGFYNITGSNTLSLGEIIKNIELTTSSKAIIFYPPLKMFIYVVKVLEKMRFIKRKLPINSEQLLRIKENKIYNSDLKKLMPEYKLASIKDSLKSQFLEIKKFLL